MTPEERELADELINELESSIAKLLLRKDECVQQIGTAKIDFAAQSRNVPEP